MKCPICNVELRTSDREGIEIDYCPQCGGIWLDGGELDKVIERSTLGSGADRVGYRHRRNGVHHLQPSSSGPSGLGRHPRRK